jgi:hypothetical protein
LVIFSHLSANRNNTYIKWQRIGGEKKRKFFSLSLLRSVNESARLLACIPDPTAIIKVERERRTRERDREENLRRTIHSHTLRAAAHIHTFIQGKPCAAVEAVYNTNPILIFLSVFFLFCAPIRREKREKEKKKKKKKRAKCTTSASGTLSIDVIVLY